MYLMKVEGWFGIDVKQIASELKSGLYLADDRVISFDAVNDNEALKEARRMFEKFANIDGITVRKYIGSMSRGKSCIWD